MKVIYEGIDISCRYTHISLDIAEGIFVRHVTCVTCIERLNS